MQNHLAFNSHGTGPRFASLQGGHALKFVPFCSLFFIHRMPCLQFQQCSYLSCLSHGNVETFIPYPPPIFLYLTKVHRVQDRITRIHHPPIVCEYQHPSFTYQSYAFLDRFSEVGKSIVKKPYRKQWIKMC